MLVFHAQCRCQNAEVEPLAEALLAVLTWRAVGVQLSAVVESFALFPLFSEEC